MRYLIYNLFVIFASIIYSMKCYNSIKMDMYKEDSNLRDYVSKTSAIGTYNESATSCGIRCAQVEACQSFFYRKTTKECRLIPFRQPLHTEQEDGWVLYKTEIVKSEHFGGYGGDPFNDETVSYNGFITALTLRCGHHLVSIRLRYGKVWTPFMERVPDNCTNSHEQKTYELHSTEYIKGVNISYDIYINSVVIFTNERELERCGTTQGSTKVMAEEPGKLRYISGGAGCVVDFLHLYWSD